MDMPCRDGSTEKPEKKVEYTVHLERFVIDIFGKFYDF